MHLLQAKIFFGTGDTIREAFDSAQKVVTSRSADTVGRHRLDSIHSSIFSRPTHADHSGEWFAIILQSLVELVLVCAWGTIIYYFIKRLVARKKTGEGEITLTNVYGAWQGHNLGTTSMEPGDLTRIEGELLDAGKNTEDNI
jgi:hypothetical protein